MIVHICALLGCVPPAGNTICAQPKLLRTEAANPQPWRTPYVEVIGVDGPSRIDHGRVRAPRVERRMLVVNRTPDSLWFQLRGCCGNDYYSMDREVLAAGDTAHLVIGFDISHVIGLMQKSTRLTVRDVPYGRSGGHVTEEMVFHTRVTHILDLVIQTPYLMLPAAVDGRETAGEFLAVITADDTLRLLSANMVNVPQGIHATLTNAHPRTLAPGDTLRLQVRIAPLSAERQYGGPAGSIQLTTSSTQFPIQEVPVYLLPPTPAPASR